jgi:hypothetical protein
LRCEGTRSWREEFVDKRFASTDRAIGIRIVVNKNEGQIAANWAIFKYKLGG